MRARALSRGARTTIAVFVAAVAITLVVRPQAIVGLGVLGLVLVPLERLFSLRPQRVLRPGLVTDLTHLLVNGFFVGAATIALVVVAAIPFVPIRRLDLVGDLPAVLAVDLAAVLVFVGGYWGHRLNHQLPFLWRFHAVHHSTEQMDWVAAGRLHPLDSAFTQACAVLPLVVLGYDAGVFAGVTVVITVLAIFQHANVRIRFPVVRWILPTPEWHHWHHARDAAARDTNFGLPVVDAVFGTAYLPRGARPTGFGIADRVPSDGYVQHLAYPFTGSARHSVERGDESFDGRREPVRVLLGREVAEPVEHLEPSVRDALGRGPGERLG
jgi:sterol desaturase/sphingolipid hydroxylase (fatty acid hydroxylase superfamily)